MKTFTWGIVGPGQIAQQFAEDMQLATAAEYKIGAVLGRTLESAKEFAEEHGAESYFENMDAFLEHGKMDAVYIATPHPLHFHQTLQCLNKGIPVLCEKPLAVNEEQTSEMIALAQQKQVYLMEGLWVLFLPSTDYILDKLKNSRLGNIKEVKSNIGFVADKDPDARYFDADLGGGSLLDVGIYNVFLAQLLLGQPQSIKAEANLSKQSVDKDCSFEFTYENGALAKGNSSFVEELETTATIECENGKLVIGAPWQEQPSEIRIEYNDGTTETHHPQWEGHGFQYEIDAVCQDIQAGRLQNEKATHTFSNELMQTLDEIREQTGIVYPYDANPDANPETGEQEAAGNGQQAIDNKQGATGNEQQATGNKQGAIGNGQQAIGNKQGATGNEQQAAGNEQEEAGNKPRLLTKEVGFAEGPLWHPDGFLLFSDQEENVIKKITPHGKLEIYIENSGGEVPAPHYRPDSIGSNALAWMDGKLLACRHGVHSLATYENGQWETLVDSYQGKPLNSPNDFIVAKDSTIYFSDPPYGLKDQQLHPETRQPLGGLYSYKNGLAMLLWDGMKYPNGVELSPDETILYVSSNSEEDKGIFKTHLNEGMPLKFEQFTETRADGILIDETGNLYTASGSSVLKFNPEGQQIGEFKMEGDTTNLAWGGESGRDLYITGHDAVWMIENVK